MGNTYTYGEWENTHIKILLGGTLKSSFFLNSDGLDPTSSAPTFMTPTRDMGPWNN